MKKFGARIVANQHFKPAPTRASARRTTRCCSPPVNRDYDVVFVADDAFEFARQRAVPDLVRPRPVVGAIDLEPVAWHWTWERNGGPQVNSRFNRTIGGRRMEGADWAAWIAVKMVVQATLRTRSADFAKQRAFILGDNDFDGDKGLARQRAAAGTSSCGRRSCSPRPMRWSPARRSRASCIAPTSSIRSATTSRRRRAS